jgi:cation diffusion facilitator family transporter
MSSGAAHDHGFLGAAHAANERRTWLVVALTSAMMVAEIVGGAIFGSMAVVADGWHMATHAGALAISALAYRYARRHANDARFCFGTGKLGELAGYSSALILGVVAILIGYESVRRVFDPVTIRFDEAILIACIGLAVNVACAWILRDRSEHRHDEAAAHAHHDHNLRAAYLHVLTDAFTSILAIVALLAGRFFAWVWMDPAIGIVGAVVIAHWSLALLRSAGAVLLDAAVDPRVIDEIRSRLELGTDRLTDLHVWRVGPGHVAVIAAIASERPESAERYKARLSGLAGLSHVTIEVHGRT